MTTQAPELHINSLAPDKLVMSGELLAAHVKRVESLCELIERLGKAIAESPYAALLPADLIADLTKL